MSQNVTSTPLSTTSRNDNFPFSIELQRNFYLGLTMPLTSRALVEVITWRELKLYDGSLNIGHKVLASAACIMIAIASLVEKAVRYTFAFLLIPMAAFGMKGRDLYVAYLHGTAMNFATPFLGLVGTIMCITNTPAFSNRYNYDTEGNRKSVEEKEHNDILREIEAKQFRDAFRGEFTEMTFNHKTKEISYKKI